LRDRDADGLDEHSGEARQMWLSAKGDTKGWVEFDFGTPQKLSTICLWNYNDTWHTDRGVRTANISVWTQEAGWKTIRTDLSFEPAEGGDSYDEPTVVTLDAVAAQKVRFDNFTSLGDTEFLGLSNAQFFQPRGPQAAQPSPRDGADGAGVGDLELTWLAGEDAKAHNIYVGASPDDLKLLGKVGQAGAKLSNLKNNSKYYWRVDEVQADDSVVASKIWSFTTGGLAGWWKLDETEGTKVVDSSGNGRDGAIHGDPQWLPTGGKVGGALQFDGVDDYVDTGWAEDLPAWTVAAWVTSPAAPTSGEAAGPVHRQANFQINWNHGNDAFRGAAGLRAGDTWYPAGFGELKADTWYHLVATYDGESLKAYRDGILVTNTSGPSGHPFTEPFTLKFGKHAETAVYFGGAIDDVSIFAYALSADEVKSLYSGKLPSAIAVSSSSAGPTLIRLGTEATSPHPPDGAAGAGTVDLELTWSPGEGAQAHNVYMGANPDDLKLLAKVEQTSAKLSHLADNSRYCWRVDEVQADGSVIAGRVWGFATGGLAAWWKLDEAEGTNVADNSGGHHDGVLQGNPQWQPTGGRIGGALEFDGKDDFIQIADQAPFNTTDEVTVAAWIKVRAFDRGWQTIAAKGDYAWRLARDRQRNTLQFAAGKFEENRTVRGNIAVDDGKWHHVVGVGTPERISLYIDGVLDQTVTVPGKMQIDETPVFIGENSDPTCRGRYWNGWIDELAVFTYALNDEQVKALYADKAPKAIVAQVSPTEPTTPEASVPPAAVVPAPGAAASLQPQPQVQPVSAAIPAPENVTPQPAATSGNLTAVLVIVAAVGLIAGLSTLRRHRT
jgi:hypothetical protein